MAKKDEAAKNELATTGTTELAVMDASMFAEDIGSGMENADSESFAIPFLSVLQKGSPQVDEATGQAIDGAKAGMFFDNVTNSLADGKKGVILVPCAYKRVFIHWGPREGNGQGFKGELSPEAVAQLRAEGKVVEVEGKLFFPLPDGSINPKKCDRVQDTRNHYVLVVDEETGAYKQALLSLTSTQIKKSKALMSALASVQINVPGRGMATPPTFANLVRATTVGEQNDQGSWFGIRFELAGQVKRRDLYEAAKAFHATVKAGPVEAKYDAAAAGGEPQGGGF